MLMEDVLKKKINLLVHLANADGKFHSSERKFLEELLQTHGVKDFDFNKTAKNGSPFDDAGSIVEKEELLYWAFQLIKIDGEIHPDEIAYCKALAIKLNFMPGIVDHYKSIDLPPLNKFREEAFNYRFKLD